MHSSVSGTSLLEVTNLNNKSMIVSADLQLFALEKRRAKLSVGSSERCQTDLGGPKQTGRFCWEYLSAGL